MVTRKSRREIDKMRQAGQIVAEVLALVESGLTRDDAYRLVQRNAMRAWDEEVDFRELARADDEIAGRIDLDAVFDLDAYTRHVDTIFARLHTLAAKEEPVHA